jgi:hypothetical protein
MTLAAGTSPMFRSFEQRTASAFSYLILLGGIATAAVAAYMVVVCYSSLPWSDGWAQITVAVSGESPFSLHWLWQQHNEHRLVLTKLLLGLDLQLFAAKQKLLLTAIYCVQLLQWCLLTWSMRVLGGWRGELWRTGAGLVAFCLFCPTQWENFVWGFQSCFVLPPLFATLSCIGLLLYWQAQGPGVWKFILLSVVAALAAVCSLANGLLLLPLLAVAALVLRLKRSVVLTYVIGAIVSFAVYFYHYVRPSQNSDPLTALRSPGRLIGYAATYLGSSWTIGHSWDGRNLTIALVVGLCGIAVLLSFVLRFRMLLEREAAFSIQLLLLALFCAGSAFLTATGRAGSGNGQAFSSRYQTVALLFWFSLGCLVLTAASASSGRLTLLAIQAFFVLVLLRGAALVRLPLGDAREHAFNQRAASAALLSGVNDREQITYVFFNPDYVLQVAPFMREKRVSIFADGDQGSLGAPIESIAQIGDRQQCEGELQSVTTLDSGDLRITGWAWGLQRHKPATRVFTVSNAKIIGFGAVGEWRPAVRAVHHEMRTSFVGFTAYAKAASQARVTVYAVLPGEPSQACQIAGIQR